MVNHKIIFDFGCDLDIESLWLYPTSNGPHSERGMKDFIIEMSLDTVIWHLVLEDTLRQSMSSCDKSPGKFPIRMYGRFVRLTSLSHYVKGTGLQYIQFLS